MTYAFSADPAQELSDQSLHCSPFQEAWSLGFFDSSNDSIIPSGHIVFLQRRIYVRRCKGMMGTWHKTSNVALVWRCIDVNATLYKRHFLHTRSGYPGFNPRIEILILPGYPTQGKIKIENSHVFDMRWL